MASAHDDDDGGEETKKSILMNDVNQDIPIFLRKTYHMIDTCDTLICSWSDDGETFVVKNPTKFEKEIIPQFFKHNKFSSFVRQLNFYAFRKIKTNNNIRIDPALEAKTANYWRFYHPKFQRGRADWLKEIKRSNSTPRGAGGGKKGGGGDENVTLANGRNNNNSNNLVLPIVTSSASTDDIIGQKDDSELKSEVTTLKERIEAMNKNIDLLTTMVQNVTLVQQTTTTNNTLYEEGERNDDVVFNGNNKRSKISSAEQQQSTNTTCVPDEMISSSSSLNFSTTCAVDIQPQLPIMPYLMSSSSSSSSGGGGGDGSNLLFNKDMRQSSELSDQGFVDTLFTVFKGEGDDDSVEGELIMTDDMGISSTTTITDANTTSPITDASPWLTSTSISSVINEYQNYSDNIINNNDIISNQRQRHRRPRTELMNRLSDALSLLPRDIQELIVDRLIQAITSPKEIQLSLNVTNALEEVVAAAAAITANTDGVPVSTVPQSPKHINDESEMFDSTTKTTAAAGAIRDTTSTMTDDDDDDDDDDDMDSVVPFASADVITCTAMVAAVNKRNPTLPLAAATLAALLSQYQEQQCAAAVVAATQHDVSKSSKGLIPVHVS
mmetsp:Transcript_34348/g.38360  ORF Transcript_34348/g.38360 Transcript_34348/m.38360 type:complete len:609 (-) Transcript_34348:77-1903(-)